MSEQQPEQQQVVVVGADGQPVGTVSMGVDGSVEPSKQQSPADMIEQPAKVMRIGSMVKQLLEEVRAAPLDEASRAAAARGAPPLDRGAQRGPGARAARGARAADAAVHRRPGADRRRAAHRAGPARRLARGAVPRHPDGAVRPADGRAGAARADARPRGAAAAAPAAPQTGPGGGTGRTGRHRASTSRQSRRRTVERRCRRSEPALEDLRDAVVVVGRGDLVGGVEHVGVGVAHARPSGRPRPASAGRWACRRRR